MSQTEVSPPPTGSSPTEFAPTPEEADAIFGVEKPEVSEVTSPIPEVKPVPATTEPTQPVTASPSVTPNPSVVAAPETLPDGTPKPPVEVKPATTPPISVEDVNRAIQELPAAIQKALKSPDPEVAAAAKVAAVQEWMKPEEADNFIKGGAETAKFVNDMINKALDTVRRETAETIIAEVIQKRIAPLQEYALAIERKQAEETFVKDNPDLKDYIQEATVIANQLKTKKNYTSTPELLKDVAVATRSYVEDQRKRFGVVGQSGAASVPPPRSTTVTPVRKPAVEEPEEVNEMKAVLGYPG